MTRSTVAHHTEILGMAMFSDRLLEDGREAQWGTNLSVIEVQFLPWFSFLKKYGQSHIINLEKVYSLQGNKLRFCNKNGPTTILSKAAKDLLLEDMLIISTNQK